MQLVYEEREGLPKLAWLAVFRRGEAAVRVLHGPWVETREGFFVEGAWDGDFAKGDFADAPMLMGSGGIAEDGSVLLCGAAHPMERLYLIRDGDTLFVSQSLLFVLRAAGARPDLQHIPYQADLLEFQRGLARHVGELPLAEGRSVTVVHFRNVRVRPDLSYDVLRKPPSPEFPDFAAYQDYLLQGLATFRDNAASPDRERGFLPITTVSSGYDSAACAALSVEIGCRDAVTIKSSRPEGGGEALDDSGTPVADALGLVTREFERGSYRALDTLPEAEFVACGDLGQDLPMVAMEDAFAGRFVLTGEHGDTMWSRQWDHRKDTVGVRDIYRPSCTGCSLIEYRLRVGFFHLPLPCVGAESLPDLKRICATEEMAPWTLGNDYDRPIARRFVEERGVARELFGQDKKAVTVLLNTDEALPQLMTEASYASFRRFHAEHAGSRGVLVQGVYQTMYRLYRLWKRSFGRVNRVLSRRGIPWLVPCPIPNRFHHSPGGPSFLFHWGVEHTIDRYADADEAIAAAVGRT